MPCGSTGRIGAHCSCRGSDIKDPPQPPDPIEVKYKLYLLDPPPAPKIGDQLDGMSLFPQKPRTFSCSTDHIPLDRRAHYVSFRPCAICVPLSKLRVRVWTIGGRGVGNWEGGQAIFGRGGGGSGFWALRGGNKSNPSGEGVRGEI